jgi:hypothetical protein
MADLRHRLRSRLAAASAKHLSCDPAGGISCRLIRKNRKELKKDAR